MESSVVTSNSIVREVLDQHNYEDWSARVKIYLLAEDLWDVVDKEPPKLEEKEAEYKAWTTKNAKALHAITISCGTQIFSFIRVTSTAKKAWEVLEKQFKAEYIVELEKKANANKPNDDFDSSYQAFFDSVAKGDWDNAKELLVPNAVRARNPADGGYTALHVAARKGHAHIVKELLKLMSQEDLEIRDVDGRTALHVAIKKHVQVKRQQGLEIVKELVQWMRKEALEIKDGRGYTALARAIGSNEYSEGDLIEMIKLMVVKNPNIVHNVSRPYDYIPVVQAWGSLKFQAGHYLYSVTPKEALLPPENGSHGATLIYYCLKAKQFDIPWHLLSICPRLATVETINGFHSPLLTLSRMHSAFLTGMRLKFWQKWIYDNIRVPAPPILDIHDLSIDVTNSEDDGGIHRDLIFSAACLYKRLVKNLLKVLGIIRIYEMKLIQIQMFELMRCMGEATRNDDDLILLQLNLKVKSIFEAIEQGDLEFVTRVCKANPRLVYTLDEKERSIYHFAIECRQEKIYCLIYGLEKEKRNQFVLRVARFNNTMLHGAANLSPLSQSNHIQGASLQMQRELQWFKEVKSLISPANHEVRNTSDHLTARELFHKNHEKLMAEAEISMKGIATSCTVVGALIVTIMFAAAFTIPGGNNGTTGFPMFIEENLFLVFIASDSVSLISSTTSVIIFLGILTSRYSDEDFLTNLPKKMMIGLFTLFIAMTTMMIAFSCGLYIMLHEKYSWVAIPGVLVASIPVISFVWMLFPLLIQTLISTYGPGIFNKKVKQWY